MDGNYGWYSNYKSINDKVVVMPNSKKKTAKVKVKKVVVHHPDCKHHPKNKVESVEESQRRFAAINDNHIHSWDTFI